MKNAENPILSISLLASDRLSTIPRCLDSLTPIREAIPCELIIVDTSNNPEVHECILKYTDIVEKFEWCNDFSKARNVGVRKSKGEWFMFIDDDEWFLDSEPLIQFFTSGEYANYGYAHYRIRNYLNESFKTYSEGWVRRLVKLRNDTKFYSKVHEYIEPCMGENKSLDAMVGHSGYIYKTSSEKLKHFKRNSSLLEIMEEEEPDNLRWKTQQIQEYRSIGAWDKLEEYCKAVITKFEETNARVELLGLSQICIGYAMALFSMKKYDDVKELYKKYEPIFNKTLLARAYMYTIMMELHYNLSEYNLMKDYVLKYFDAYEIYKKNSKQFKYEREAVRIITGEAFSQRTLCLVETAWVVVELKDKNYDVIYERYSRLGWGTQHQRFFYKVDMELIEALFVLKDYDMLKRFINDALSSEFIKPNIIQTIIGWRKRNDEEFKKLLEVVKEVDIWEWYKIYMELLSKDGAIESEARRIGAAFVQETPNVFQVPNMVSDSLRKHGVTLESLYQELDFLTWKNQVVEHFNCVKLEQLDELKERLENSSLKDDVRFGYFMMLYSEQKLVQSLDAGLHMDEYSNLLASFSTYTCTTYEALYGTRIRELPAEELPNNYHAALLLQKFFEDAGNDLRGALPCLGKVAEVYPFLQESIKYYLHLIKTEVFQG